MATSRDQQKFRQAAEIAQLIREQTLAAQYAEHLKPFLKAAWPVMQPGVPFVDGWHIDCLCDHAEALCKRQIRRLIINISRRGTKSSVVSIATPAWRWITAPEEKFLCLSYGKNLASGFSRKTRDLVKSAWYQARWADRFSIARDQDEKGEFENDRGGYRFAGSVEGGVLGRGGSFHVYDDPNNLDLMQFSEYRQSVKDFYSKTASACYIDPKTDVRLLIQQRSTYGDDLTSFLLELGGWEQIVIPNEYDGRRIVSSIGWQDPRAKMGELMCPERFGPEETAILKREQREHYLGQFQQAPIADDGVGIKREWFRFYNPPGVSHNDEHGNPIPVRIQTLDGKTVEIAPVELPTAFEHCVDSWDMAFKSADHNDYVAGHQWGRLGANCYLICREHGHMNFPDTLAAMRRMSTRGAQEKLVEDKANGSAVIDTLRNEIPGIIAVNPEGGKWARTAAISGYIEAGNVFLPNPDLFPWVWDILKECADGATAKHDDDRDAMTQALKRLYDSMSRTGVPEFRVQPRGKEPKTACHVAAEIIPPWWRRMVAIVPNQGALWMAETPTGALRVMRELSLAAVDATQAGREIARVSLPDVLNRVSGMREIKRQSYELLMPKLAFAPVEPIGCYAELLEQSLLAYESEEGNWEARERSKVAIKEARFRSDMVEEEDVAIDRLRALLAFQPPDFQHVPYDRQKALALAEQNIHEYQNYMAATEGQVRGEWPKLKISPDCVQLIAQLGSFRRDKIDEAPAFVRALLLGVCAQRITKAPEVREGPVPAQRKPTLRNSSLMMRKFALRR